MTGGGLLQSGISWFVANFGLGIVMIAVLFSGILLMTGRMHWPLAVCICAGAVIIGNYQTIAPVLMTAGGALVAGP